MGTWFDCKYTNDDACEKCSGCRECLNCKYSDDSPFNDYSFFCNECDDNPYNDDRNK